MPYTVIPEDSIVPWQQLEVYISLFRFATVDAEKFHHMPVSLKQLLRVVSEKLFQFATLFCLKEILSNSIFFETSVAG